MGQQKTAAKKPPDPPEKKLENAWRELQLLYPKDTAGLQLRQKILEGGENARMTAAEPQVIYLDPKALAEGRYVPDVIRTLGHELEHVRQFRTKNISSELKRLWQSLVRDYAAQDHEAAAIQAGDAAVQKVYGELVWPGTDPGALLPLRLVNPRRP
jgi:hypothetical protein